MHHQGLGTAATWLSLPWGVPLHKMVALPALPPHAYHPHPHPNAFHPQTVLPLPSTAATLATFVTTQQLPPQIHHHLQRKVGHDFCTLIIFA
ncbi:hypothetical protein M8J76_003768 [Diaphorina citri]|nr:hypothetical protein M8J76_003768 [Diaphorina citri]